MASVDHATLSHGTYRPEIDGLRAIAVIAVIIYHAKFQIAGHPLLPGGYLGVDIFFVISGYLITRIILEQLDARRFSVLGFFARRIRRIVPALLLVIAASIAAAWFLLLPSDMMEFAASGLSAIFSVSNIWFWREDSYLAQESLLKPLLHTWSLGVEEQFYLLMPPLLLLLHRFAGRFLQVALIGMAILSLVAAEYLSRAAPDAAFYLLPARGWELLAGSLLAFREVRGKQITGGPTGDLLAIGGLAAIVGSMLLFNDQTRHPSLLTVVPVAGAVAVIWFARANVSARLLSAMPLVAIGLISYSLYLWHFPVLAFGRIMEGGAEPETTAKLLLIGLVAVLSVASYFLVERPFRFGRPASVYLAVTFAIAAGLAGTLAHLFLSDGAPYRLAPSLRASYEELESKRWARLRNDVPGLELLSGKPTKNCYGRDPREACQFGDGKWVALGDSHMAHYEHALLEQLEGRGAGMISFVHGTCMAVTDLWSGDAACPLVNDLRRERIAGFKEQKVFVISGNYEHLFREKKRTSDPLADGRNDIREGVKVPPIAARDNFRAYIADILAKGHVVVLIYSIPRPHEDVLRRYFSILQKDALGEGQPRLEPVFNRRSNEFDWVRKRDAFLAIPNHPNLIKIYPRNILCPDENGERRCLIINENGPIYHNRGHLSIIGARLIIDRVMKTFDVWERRQQAAAKAGKEPKGAH